MSDFLAAFCALARALEPTADRADDVMLTLLHHAPDEEALARDVAQVTEGLAGLGVDIESWTEPHVDDDVHHPLGLDVVVRGHAGQEIWAGGVALVGRLREAPELVDEVNLLGPCEDLQAAWDRIQPLIVADWGQPAERWEASTRGWTEIWEGGTSHCQFLAYPPAFEDSTPSLQLGAASVLIEPAQRGAFAPADAVVASDIAFTRRLADAALPLIRLGGNDAAARFKAAIDDFRAESPHGFCLMPWPVEAYADHALFLTPDARAGLAVGADGMLHSVFSSPSVRQTYGIAADQPSPGTILTDLALRLGARELNCFDNGVTRQFYERHGFEVTARFPFDPEQAIPGWRYGVYDVDGREPDFLVMTWHGAARGGDETAR